MTTASWPMPRPPERPDYQVPRPANDNKLPMPLPKPANDNKPGRPRPRAPGIRPRPGTVPGGFVADFIIDDIITPLPGDLPLTQPGWTLVPGCRTEPGDFFGVGSLYCGTLATFYGTKPTPAGVQDQGSSWALYEYLGPIPSDFPGFEDGYYHYHRAWSRPKAAGNPDYVQNVAISYVARPNPERDVMPRVFPVSYPDPLVLRGPSPQPRTNPDPAYPKPPGRDVKERKYMGNLTSALAKFAEGISEGKDAVNAIYDALPDYLKKQLGLGNGYKDILKKLEALYRHWDKIDGRKATENLLFANQSDRYIGRFQKALSEARKHLRIVTGPAVHGVSR